MDSVVLVILFGAPWSFQASDYRPRVEERVNDLRCCPVSLLRLSLTWIQVAWRFILGRRSTAQYRLFNFSLFFFAAIIPAYTASFRPSYSLLSLFKSLKVPHNPFAIPNLRNHEVEGSLSLFLPHLGCSSSPFSSDLAAVGSYELLLLNMVKFTLFLFIFFTSAIFISQAAEAPVPVGVTSREEHLSNAERLRRGLPLKKPKRYYDPRQRKWIAFGYSWRKDVLLK